MKGHFKGELWGLAVHPHDKTEFITVGEDCMLSKWEFEDKTQLKCIKMDY